MTLSLMGMALTIEAAIKVLAKFLNQTDSIWLFHFRDSLIYRRVLATVVMAQHQKMRTFHRLRISGLC
jgi:hypothetical protein